MNQKEGQAQIKLVVVGDGSVGKTCVLLSYTADNFLTEYVPTVFENYTKTLNIDGKEVDLSLWDTAGQETFTSLRTLAYENTDIFLIIYSVIDESSYENAKEKWYLELNEGKLKKVPKIFVGNKIDIRNTLNQNHIQFEKAQQELKNYNALHKECSALTKEGLEDLFQEAARQGFKYYQQQQLFASAKDQPISGNERSCCQTF
ncbi:unnamed protein product [Paramecium sonneborni]|uniref:Uncharacterized protein n=1 Tax=Paramecium sonneborni TaxID=65129 RepID=A0A8S1MZG7_9CILI|nr:unnamed protein product [Paramecium sonneborni]